MATTSENTIAFDITVNPNGAVVPAANLKKALREANQEAIALAQQFGNTSTQAIKAAQKVANLKEEIADVKGTIDALHPEAKFNAIGSAVQGIAGGFSAVEGAMALFGTQSEEVQQQLLKVQGAMAFSQGINQVLGLKDAFSNLGILIKSTTAYQAIYNFVVGAGTQAMKLFRGALVATGIGALIVGLGLLIANFDKLKKIVTENSETIKEYALAIYKWLTPIGLIQNGIEALGKKFTFVQAVIDRVKQDFTELWIVIRTALEAVNILDTAEENAAQDAAEAAEERTKQMDILYKARQREIELMKAQGATDNEIRAAEIDNLKIRLQAYLKFVEAKKIAGEELSEDEKDKLAEFKQAYQLAILNDEKLDKEETAKKLKEQQDRAKKLAEERKKADEERRKAAEEEARRLLEIEKQLQDERIKAIANAHERERAETIADFNRRIAAITGNSEVEIDLRNQLEANKQTSLRAIDQRFEQEQAQKELDKIKQDFTNAQARLQAQIITSQQNSVEFFDLERQLENKRFEEKLALEKLSNEQVELARAEHNAAMAKIDADEAAADLALRQQVSNAKRTLEQNTLNAVSALGSLFIKDQQKLQAFNKTVAIAQLSIDTAKSISATIAGATAAAAAGGPAAPFLLAGYITSGIATVASAFASAKKILGDSGSANISAGSTAPAVRFTSTQSDITTLQRPGVDLAKPAPVVKAIVTETDITKAQDRIKTIEEKATF